MENTSLSDRLCQEIVADIRHRGLGPGAGLPSARQLATRFEVTVPTVREALRRLEATSIVELRHGSGTYVAEGVDRPFLVNPYLGERTLASAIELAEARLMLEPEIAAEAARRRTPEDLDRMTAALGNALTDAGDVAPRPFHAELARASGNAIAAQVLEALLEMRQLERRTIRTVYGDREVDHREHLEIHQAVDAGDADAARSLTAAHLTHIRDQLRRAAEEAEASR